MEKEREEGLKKEEKEEEEELEEEEEIRRRAEGVGGKTAGDGGGK